MRGAGLRNVIHRHGLMKWKICYQSPSPVRDVIKKESVSEILSMPRIGAARKTHRHQTDEHEEPHSMSWLDWGQRPGWDFRQLNVSTRPNSLVSDFGLSGERARLGL